MKIDRKPEAQVLLEAEAFAKEKRAENAEKYDDLLKILTAEKDYFSSQENRDKEASRLVQKHRDLLIFEQLIVPISRIYFVEIVEKGGDDFVSPGTVVDPFKLGFFNHPGTNDSLKNEYFTDTDEIGASFINYVVRYTEPKYIKKSAIIRIGTKEKKHIDVKLPACLTGLFMASISQMIGQQENPNQEDDHREDQ